MGDASVHVIVDGWTYGPFYSPWTVEQFKRYFGYSEKSVLKSVEGNREPQFSDASILPPGTYELVGEKTGAAVPGASMMKVEIVKKGNNVTPLDLDPLIRDLKTDLNQLADEILTEKRLFHQMKGLAPSSPKHDEMNMLQSSLRHAEEALHHRNETVPVLSSLLTELHDALAQSKKKSPRIKSPSMALSPFHKIRDFDKAVHVAEEIHLLKSLEATERKSKRKKVLKRPTIPKWGPPISLRDGESDMNKNTLVKMKEVPLEEAISRMRSKLSEAMVRTETYSDVGIIQLVDNLISMERRQLDGHQGTSQCHGTRYSYPSAEVRHFILDAFNVKQ